VDDPRNPRCPWCRQHNVVAFPARGHHWGWWVNQEQENPNAAYVLHVTCSSCKEPFVVEWDDDPR
jgi:hypothetical protein